MRSAKGNVRYRDGVVESESQALPVHPEEAHDRQRPPSFEGENGRDAPVSRASVPARVLLQVVLVVVLPAEPLLELVDLGDDLLAFRVKVLLLDLLLDLLGDVALLGRRVEDG